MKFSSRPTGGREGFPLSALLRTKIIYLDGFPRRAQIVLNDAAVAVKAPRYAVGPRPSLDSHRTTAQTGLYQRGEWCGGAR